MNEGVELRKTSNKGEGVFTTTGFVGGQIIIKGVISVVLRHNNRLASQVAIGRYIIHEGLIFRKGTPDALTQDEEVKKVYLGEHFQLG